MVPVFGATVVLVFGAIVVVAVAIVVVVVGDFLLDPPLNTLIRMMMIANTTTAMPTLRPVLMRRLRFAAASRASRA